MYEMTKIQMVRDNVIRIDHQSLPETPATFLTSASLATATTLTVRDNNIFSSAAGGDLLLLGNFGDEQAEIVYVNGSVTPGTSLTTSATVFPHPVGTPVRKILFDKIEVFGNTAASSSGATALNSGTAIAIDASAPFTEYVMSATEASTYTYFGARQIRSVATTVNGTYSDFIPAAGYEPNTVGFIIKKAFDAAGEETKPTGNLSKAWAYDQIFLGEQEISNELKKWSWLQEFDYDMGNVTLGVNAYDLPTNLADRNTPKKIQGLKIGKGPALTYITRREYEALFQNVAHTTVGTTYLAAAASVVLTDTRDLDDSGGVNVYTAGVIDGISYTTNTRATNTLSGVTSNDSGGTAGDPVWQHEQQGMPSRYTVFEGKIYFDSVPDLSTNLVGSNIWLDYYKTVTRANSDGDTITVPDPYLIQLWLEMMIKKHKQGGTLDLADPLLIEFTRKKQRLVNNEVSGQGVNLVPTFYEDYEYPAGSNYIG